MKEEKTAQLYLMVCTQLRIQLYVMVGTQLLLLWLIDRHLHAVVLLQDVE
jgi:hypothetical protein